MIHKGTAVSKGVAIGKVFVHKPFSAKVGEAHFPERELKEHLERYRGSIRKAEEELLGIKKTLEESDPEKAAILKAHLEILHDDVLSEEILDLIVKERCMPDWAVERVFTDSIALFDDVDDELIKERVADLRDVKTRLLRNWFNVDAVNLGALTEPVVVAAHDLLPSDTATINKNMVLGIVTEVGGTTSHTAIIARSYKIPAIAGISGLMEIVAAGSEVIVDALQGNLLVDFSAEEKALFEERREDYQRKVRETEKFIGAEPKTQDGTRIDIGLNISSGNASALAGSEYTDYVGLFRTEFLYMEKSSLPGEEEQYRVYRNVLEHYNPRPVTIRTLDAGGDKTLQCMELPSELNPFLGNRALRLCFSKNDIFKSQLRALLRASVHGNLWLMLPMVASMDDIRRAKSIVAEAKKELEAEGILYSREMKLGIMIEVPSIALIADKAAGEVDFASIGTNDLCQYLTAVDRLNPLVAEYYQCCHPAMFRLIGNIVREFERAGKPLSVCGEMGGDPLSAAALIGLGLRKLSMGANSIADIKCMLSKLTMPDAEALADAVKNCDTAAAAEVLLGDHVCQH